MHLIEIFLPLADSDGQKLPHSLFTDVRDDMVKTFDGVTMFSRAPAHGITQESGTKVDDDIVVVEVMTDTLDRNWWAGYCRRLEKQFRQKEVLIRATEVTRL